MGLIRTTYQIVTEELDVDGEAAEEGWEDEEGTNYTVHAAISLLRGAEPSCPEFYPGVWYTIVEEQDYRDGSTTSRSYHLVTRGVRRGRWTVAQERAVYEGVKR